MLNCRRCLHDVDECLGALTAVGRNADVVMSECDDLMAPVRGRMHRNAFGAVTDLDRGTMIANPKPLFRHNATAPNSGCRSMRRKHRGPPCVARHPYMDTAAGR